jgi:hypothetical protein
MQPTQLIPVLLTERVQVQVQVQEQVPVTPSVVKTRHPPPPPLRPCCQQKNLSPRYHW